MKLIKIAILLLIVAVLASQTNIIANLMQPRNAYAVGDLEVDFGPGITPGDPIFTVSNIAPGDSEAHDVKVKNNATTARPVAVKGVPTDDTDNLSTQMDIIITDGATTLYGPKTVSEFFTDSTDPEGIPLSTVNPGQTKTYTFTVTFKEIAGNEFQNTSLTFNIVIGLSVDIPLACEDIDLGASFPIFGTTGNDTIRGTTKRDIIFALEGNDRVLGGTDDDCIVGGPGNDELRGETANDIIFGNEGNDLLIGATGEDIIIGGSGNDTIRAENGDDIVEGNEGDDTITAGTGEDVVSGNAGNDTISGENGDDDITGDAGNDIIDGGSGVDKLIGGDDTDTAHGKSGTDTCSAEIKTSCEIVI